MGSVRKLEYDAVIGVGGIGSEAQANRISGMINWIGIGPHKRVAPGKRGPEVTFDHFHDFGKKGRDFCELSPMLAHRMYSKNVRYLIVKPNDKEYGEVSQIVAAARSAQRLHRSGTAQRKKCQRNRRKTGIPCDRRAAKLAGC